MSNQSGATQFRAALHGFNREDVVTYIDRMTKEQEAALSRLQYANGQLQTQLEQSNAALAQLRESSAPKGALDEANAQIRSLSNENAELRTQLQELEQSRAQLLEAVHTADTEGEREPAQPDLAAPADGARPECGTVLKEDAKETASLDYKEQELAAYRRAEMAERLARQRAANVYSQIREVFEGASQRMDTGKTDLDLMLKTLRADVDQLMAVAANLRGSYTQTVSAFSAINEQNQLPAGEKD